MHAPTWSPHFPYNFFFFLLKAQICYLSHFTWPLHFSSSSCLFSFSSSSSLPSSSLPLSYFFLSILSLLSFSHHRPHPLHHSPPSHSRSSSFIILPLMLPLCLHFWSLHPHSPRGLALLINTERCCGGRGGTTNESSAWRKKIYIRYM